MSLLTVAVRSSFYKIAFVLLVMSAVQLGMFYRAYLEFDYSQEYSADVVVGEEMPGQAYGVEWTLESLVEKSSVSLVFLAAFGLIGLILYWAESERKGSNTFYFYNRLTLSKQKRIGSLAVYNGICLIVLLFAELLTALGMGMIFSHLAPEEYQSLQMYFMAFYKSEFLHCLFPMAEIYKWIRNILLFSAVALDIAVCACSRRKSWSVFLLILLVMFGFVQKIGTYGAMDLLMITTAVVCIAVDAHQVWRKGAEDDF